MKLPVLSLDEYIAQAPKGMERVEVLPARTLPVSRPFCFTGTTELVESEREYFPPSLPVPALDVITLRNATVVGAGLVITEDGVALLGHDTLPAAQLTTLGRVDARHDPQARTLTFATPPKPPATLRKTAALLSRPGISVYFHLMVDILPRLFAIEETKTRCDAVLLLANTPKYFQALMAQGTEFGPDRQILGDGSPVKVKRLVIPRVLFRMDHWIYPELSAYLRRVGERLAGGATFGTLPRNVYSIRREMASDRRRMLNANALAGALEDAGYVEIASGSIPLAQQAAVFMNADNIVMSIGGHNANIGFAKPGAKVLYTFADYRFAYTAPSYLAAGAGAECGFTFGSALLNPYRKQHVEFLANIDATRKALAVMA